LLRTVRVGSFLLGYIQVKSTNSAPRLKPCCATGSKYLKRWLTAPGADSPRHDLVPDLDGQTRGLDEPFDVNGYPGDYPGDPDLPPEESIACRCTCVFEEKTANVTRVDREFEG
jgi:hypothetical protein